jgi:hypothetical protein
MTIKVNENLLVIPPYISTSWDQVATLYVSDNKLVIILIDSTPIQIPNLDTELLNSVFQFHLQYLEVASEIDDLFPSYPFKDITPQDFMNSQIESGAIHFTLGTLNSLGSSSEHNPEQSNAPDLPKEVLSKILAITKIISSDNWEPSKSETNCNCFYCQVARFSLSNTSSNTTPTNLISNIPKLSNQTAKNWDVESIEPNFYMVTNRIDTKEHYNVYLGDPIRCTCGQTGCEHVVAVLKS